MARRMETNDDVQAFNADANNSTSVVPGLMRVYENMTKRSNPQNNNEHHHQSVPHYDNNGNSNHYMGSGQDQYNFAYGGGPLHTSAYEPIQVPSIPHAAYAAMSENSYSRPTRKRSAQTANFKEDAVDSVNSDRSSSNQRNSSASGKSRKKATKDSDDRWSKRFTWPEDLHRDFVSAVFEVGLKHSSPLTILEHMPNHEQITAERIKSHLQKYRKHRDKSKQNFMSAYDETLSKIKQHGGLDRTKSLSGGEVPGHLTYATMHEGEDAAANEEPSTQVADAGDDKKALLPHAQESLVLPRLTEEEKSSAIGASLGYLLGLFFSLKQQLLAQRAMQQQHLTVASASVPNAIKSHDQPVVAVFDSFVKETGASFEAPAAQAPAAASHSTRNNIEENSMMKREMQNQMAFQNKMRALKQQELNKYRREPSSGLMQHDQEPYQLAHYADEIQHKDSADFREEQQQPAEYNNNNQGAGETAIVDQRSRGISIGDSVSNEDFWNTDVVDEQLFEFLMHN
jgi:SHAQKYF class myb-like DNA-binding protein